MRKEECSLARSRHNLHPLDVFSTRMSMNRGEGDLDTHEPSIRLALIFP